MNATANPTASPEGALLLALWDLTFALRLLEHVHGEDCDCDLCEAVLPLPWLLGFAADLIEDAYDAPGSLAPLWREWECTRGRPHASADLNREPNPAAVAPEWGEDGPAPAGTAEAWDAQFVSVEHRVMTSLWNTEGRLQRLEEAHGVDCGCGMCRHAHPFWPLLSALIDGADGATGELTLSERWPGMDRWDEPREADTPAVVTGPSVTTGR